ncbi:MAG: hypothetical protein HRT90_06425 [Candidatus Margulisbacteria bacterium]|nr:hypothetical protein [Candidatus Margulisiibacteriota bacterium]
MIKKGIFILFILLFQTGCNFDNETRLLNQVEAMLKLPESEIDIARAKLTIDKIINPSVDVDKYLKKIDELVYKASRIKGHRIYKLHAFLYEKGPWNGYEIYRYDYENVLEKSSKSSMLTYYIDTKRGNCVSMPILYYVMAKNFGIQTELATVPRHLIAQTKMGNEWWNIETTHLGLTYEDEMYQKDFLMSKKAIKDGVYLTPVSKKKIIIIMMEQLFLFYEQNKKFELALHVNDLSQEYFPEHFENFANRAGIYRSMALIELGRIGCNVEPTELQRKSLNSLLIQVKRNLQKARSLGHNPWPKKYTETYLKESIARHEQS